MFCSVVIPTIGRLSLSRAVNSVLNQEFCDNRYEVIVVNDSGRPLTFEEWQQSEKVRIITTNQRERSTARNTGAAIAQGDYLCFLDDDDWLLPDALNVVWELVHQSGRAAWLCGGIQVVDGSENILGVSHPSLNGNCLTQVMGGAWAPIQSSLIKASSFFEVGGYNRDINGTEDQDLCRRIAMSGDFASTRTIVACLFRGQTWTTSTNYDRAASDTVYSRNCVLEEPKSFSRMVQSADSSYWYGRLFRVYASTVQYNLRRRHFASAVSRLVYGTAGFIAAGLNVLRTDFWRGVRDEHPPETLHRIMLAPEGT